MKRHLFKETQRFTTWHYVLLLLVINSLALFPLVRNVVDGISTDREISLGFEVIIPIVVILLITLFFLISRLDTIVKEDGIYVRFYPLHRKFKYYAWQDLKNSFVRKYSPLMEYGGWGYRLGFSGKAYNISGNRGLQLVLTNGDKLLIGTQKPDELEQVLNKIKSD